MKLKERTNQLWSIPLFFFYPHMVNVVNRNDKGHVKALKQKNNQESGGKNNKKHKKNTSVTFRLWFQAHLIEICWHWIGRKRLIWKVKHAMGFCLYTSTNMINITKEKNEKKKKKTHGNKVWFSTWSTNDEENGYECLFNFYVQFS